MIHVEGTEVKMNGTYTELIMEIGAAMYGLCKEISETTGREVDPYDIVELCARAYQSDEDDCDV